jgi:WD40 repeat protein
MDGRRTNIRWQPLGRSVNSGSRAILLWLAVWSIGTLSCPAPQTRRRRQRPRNHKMQPNSPCARANRLIEKAGKAENARRRDVAVELLAQAQQRCPRKKTLKRLGRILDAWAADHAKAGRIVREAQVRRAAALLLPTAAHLQRWADTLERLARFGRAQKVLEQLLRRLRAQNTDRRETAPLRAALTRLRARAQRAEWCYPGDIRQAAKLLEQGLATHTRGNTPKAYQLFQRAHRLAPRAETYYWLGRCLAEMKKPLTARKMFARALTAAQAKHGRRPLPELIFGHTRDARAVSLSRDGKRLASGGGDGIVRIWDARTGKLLRKLTGPNGRVESVSFSPDGRTLAAGGEGGKIHLWPVGSENQGVVLTGHGGVVYSISFGPHGNQLVSAGSDRRVHVWNISERTKAHTLREKWPPGDPLCVRLSPDGRLLAVANEEMVTLWSLASGKIKKRLGEYRPARVNSIDFDPQGKRLVSGGADRIIRIWNLETGKTIHQLGGHQGEIATVAFAYGGRLVVSAATDGTIKLWHAGQGHLLRTLPGLARATGAMTVSADGRTMATAHADGTLRVVALPGGSTLRTLGRPRSLITSVAFAPRSPGFAVARTGGPLLLWSDRDGRPHPLLSARPIQPHALAFAQKRSILAVAGQRGGLRVWDTAEKKPVRAFATDMTRSRRVAITAAGDRLAVGSLGAVQIWSINDGRLIRALPPGRDDFFVLQSVAFSPDGKKLAAAISSTRAASILIWNIQTGVKINTLEDDESSVRQLTFSPDGKWLASSHPDRVVRIWDVEQGTLIRKLGRKKNPFKFESLLFAKGGNPLICGLASGDLQLWDLRTGALLQTLHGHKRIVSSLSLNHDASILASASWDGTVKFWDTQSKALLLTIVITRDGAWAAHTPDGYVDASAAGRRLFQWKVGNQRFFHQLAWQRYCVRGLVARVLAGDTAFRLNTLKKLVRAASKKK